MTSNVAIYVSPFREEIENLKDKCEEFEVDARVAIGISPDKHPGGYGGLAFWFYRDDAYYEIDDIEFNDDIERLVYLAETKATILKNAYVQHQFRNAFHGAFL